MVILWCIKTFGKNTRSKHPLRTYCSFDKRITDYGYFFYDGERKIVIFPHNIPNIRQFIGTILHEYKHYLQPVKGYGRKYFYSQDPQERQANKFAEINLQKCWNYVKKEI